MKPRWVPSDWSWWDICRYRLSFWYYQKVRSISAKRAARKRWRTREKAKQGRYEAMKELWANARRS